MVDEKDSIFGDYLQKGERHKERWLWLTATEMKKRELLRRVARREGG